MGEKEKTDIALTKAIDYINSCGGTFKVEWGFSQLLQLIKKSNNENKEKMLWLGSLFRKK